MGHSYWRIQQVESQPCEKREMLGASLKRSVSPTHLPETSLVCSYSLLKRSENIACHLMCVWRGGVNTGGLHPPQLLITLVCGGSLSLI